MQFNAKSGFLRLSVSFAVAALALFGVGSMAPVPAGAEEKGSSRLDASGDPLPEGAIARLGTSHWRHANRVTLVAYVNSGKELLSSCGDGFFHVWDVESGKELRRFGAAHNPPIGTVAPNRAWIDPRSVQVVLTEDGKTLANTSTDGNIHVWDIALGKELKSFAHEHGQAVSGITFTPDGKSLITRGMQDQRIKVWDPATGKLTRSFDEQSNNQHKGYFGTSNPIAISPDGKLLAGAAMDFDNKAWTSVLRVWDLGEGKEFKTIKDAGAAGRFNQLGYRPTFSPDGKHIAWPRFEGGIQIFEVESAKEVAKLGDDDVDRRVARIIYSSDGKTLAALRTDQTISLFDVAGGKQIKVIGEEPDGPLGKGMPKAMRANPANMLAGTLVLSPDGKTIAQGWGNVVRLWNIETGKGNDLAGGHRGEVQGVLVSPDGRSVLTAGVDATIRRWDLATAKEQQRIDLPAESVVTLLVNPKLAVVRDNDSSVNVWDLTAGKQYSKVDTTGMGTPIVMLATSTDAKTLVLSSQDCTVRVCNLETGKEQNTLKCLVSDNTNPIARKYLYALDCTPDGGSIGVQFQTNELVAVPGGGQRYDTKHTIRLYDAETAALLWETNSRTRCQGFQFSPDGHNLGILNAEGFDAQSQRIEPGAMCLEWASGKERWHVDGSYSMLTFSEDGQFLALGTGKGDVKVYDVRGGGKEIAAFQGHAGRVASLAFSPDAGLLFSGGGEGTTLVWDIRNQVKKAKQQLELDADAVKKLWAGLNDADAAKAFGAINALSASPKHTVACLAGQLKQEKPEDPARIDKLITDLDSDEFEVRQKAFDELSKVGVQSKVALKKALGGDPSVELRKQVEKLLELSAPGQALPAETLRDLRAIEVLELIGTPEARRVLETLAKGASGTRVTVEAEAALRRVKK